MSKPTAPPTDAGHPAHPEGPPSYNQAVSEGAQPPPGGAVYNPPPAAPYGVNPYGAGGPQQQQQYPAQQQQQQFQQQQYPAQQQQQQYGQYGAPPGGAPVQVPVAMVPTVMAGSHPMHMMCPHCHAEVDSSVRASPSSTAWIAGLLIALFGCWMGCCLIPCCMDECMDKEHFCPNCKAFLGRYRR